MLCGITNKWRQLGTQFGLLHNELETIKMNGSGPDDWLIEVIAKKKARSTHFGWTDIVTALRAIKECALADRICRKYKVSNTQHHPGNT